VIKTNILSAHSKSDITGKSVAKFCAKYLHVQILKLEGKFGLATAAKKAYFRYLLWCLFLLWGMLFFFFGETDIFGGSMVRLAHSEWTR
jgi:hypothetical protein